LCQGSLHMLDCAGREARGGEQGGVRQAGRQPSSGRVQQGNTPTAASAQAGVTVIAWWACVTWAGEVAGLAEDGSLVP
jgi:hypothetical protein